MLRYAHTLRYTSQPFTSLKALKENGSILEDVILLFDVPVKMLKVRWR